MYTVAVPAKFIKVLNRSTFDLKNAQVHDVDVDVHAPAHVHVPVHFHVNVHIHVHVLVTFRSCSS